jgi:DNA-binding MarR family transcriptional regulator/N-acetylglutamate synthase-like GNAT family acetyltransferase
MPAAEPDLERRVREVRRFNRFYTKTIGVLREGLLGSPFSLTEVRVLFELAHRRRPTASELCAELGLDPGYLSRILRGFQKRGLVTRARSERDGRQSHLSLTAAGRKAFAPLDARSHDEVATLVRRLPAPEQARLVAAMESIAGLLGDGSAAPERAPYRLRALQPGDLGWVVHRHGAVYAQEWGYDTRFEGLVARIVAEFVARFDPQRERAWIAERDGEVVGSVFLVKKTKTVAKLRLLLVEPSARGLGLGRRLVEECVGFARQAGYRKVVLWTQQSLSAARAIYQKAGFRRVAEERHRSWGPEQVSESWELDLRAPPPPSEVLEA